MKLLTYLLLGVLIFAIFRTNQSVQRAQTPREKGFMIRVAATVWLVGFMFLLALIFLPNKARVLMLLPGFFLAVTIGKAWRNARARLQQQQSGRVDIDKMKRVN